MVELVPEASEILAVKRDAVGIRGRGNAGLGRKPRDMQQRRGGSGSVGGAERADLARGGGHSDSRRARGGAPANASPRSTPLPVQDPRLVGIKTICRDSDRPHCG